MYRLIGRVSAPHRTQLFNTGVTTTDVALKTIHADSMIVDCLAIEQGQTARLRQVIVTEQALDPAALAKPALRLMFFNQPVTQTINSLLAFNPDTFIGAVDIAAGGAWTEHNANNAYQQVKGIDLILQTNAAEATKTRAAWMVVLRNALGSCNAMKYRLSWELF
ncbi:MAG: hypothetical protein JNL32_03055 [Candidatus Kapabacteria bacterium]|nr:hypothetical protein [Candidatus Kapabacteria bacterium]